MREIVFGAILLGLLGPSAIAQEVSPHFEVASVKPAAPQANGRVGLRGGPGSNDPGRITYTNVTPRMVIENAYDVLDDQVSGPTWLATERYDIAATVPASATKEQFRVMLQNLLAERFQLAFHRERKEFVVYELAVAKNGPKLKEGPPATDAKTSVSERGGRVDSMGFPVITTPHQTAQNSDNGVAKMGANQVTMPAFAQFLTFPVGFLGGGPMLTQVRVVDKTGLNGEYSFTLEYEWPGPKPPSADPGDLAPALFTALQQQVGLRLDQTKEAFDLLVIDHAEKTPTEN
jgi:uncharacterized protein (TIGR03435 family)